MVKSLKNTINTLNKYIGCEIIRVAPSITGNMCYRNSPILLLGFTSDGRIRCKNGNQHLLIGINADGKSITHTNPIMSHISDKEFILPLEFTDRHWTSYEEYFKHQKKLFEYVANNPDKYVWQ